MLPSESSQQQQSFMRSLAGPAATAAILCAGVWLALLLLVFAGSGAPPPTTASASPYPNDGPGSLYPPMPTCSLSCARNGTAEENILPPPGQTVPFDTKFSTGSDDLPLGDPILARPRSLIANSPEQIKVQLAVDGGVVISWVTGESATGKAADLLKGKDKSTGVGVSSPPASIVRFGKTPEELNKNATSPSDPIMVPGSPDFGGGGAVGGLIPAGNKKRTQTATSPSSTPSSPLPPQPRRYLQSYPTQSGGTHSYLSGWSHHVLLRSPSEVTPGERVFYQVGSGENNEWSEVRSFVAPPRSAAAVAAASEGSSKKKGATTSAAFPLVLSFIGDLGTTENSTSTLKHVAATSLSSEEESGSSSPSSAALFVVGDLVYADNYKPDGSPRQYTLLDQSNGTYQPRWDAWGRMTSDLLFSQIPIAAIAGNHDTEADGERRAYKSFLSRFEQAAAGISTSNSSPSFAPPPSTEDPTFWAKDIGPARIIGLNTYSPYHPGSLQRKWLEKALDVPPRIRNSTLPWLIVLMHAPWYTSYATHYREVECMRKSLEPLLAKAGVDMVFSGHVHAYERTYRVLEHAPSPCGPVHVTVGDGGNAERLYTTFADGWGIPKSDARKRAKACPPKGTGDECADRAPGPYCYDAQPPWSAFREPSFGHGTLTIESKEKAVWRWHRNQDGERVVSDEAVVLRGGGTCRGFIGDGEK